MGMYTEIFVKLEIKDNEDVVQILNFMMGLSDCELAVLPDHPLFKTHRWDFMLRCSSYYHIPDNLGKIWWDDISKSWWIVSLSNFKNYDNEVSLFFDWIRPYCYGYEGKMIGYSLYENDDNPTIYYM